MLYLPLALVVVGAALLCCCVFEEDDEGYPEETAPVPAELVHCASAQLVLLVAEPVPVRVRAKRVTFVLPPRSRAASH